MPSTMINGLWPKRVLPLALVGFVASGAPGCGDGRVTEPIPLANLTVSAAEPASGEQGETLDVRILGEGFVRDAIVSWRRGGSANPAIAVEQVAFVSESELIASIVIAPDADVAEYDIVVRRDRGSGEGVGPRLFAVNPYSVLSVLSAQPVQAEQGQSLDVRILGERFADDAVVSWRRGGIDESLIVVEKVTFVSETELVASIVIAPDAAVAEYDVVVHSDQRSGEGLGAHVFTVTAYTPLAVRSAHPAEGEQGRTLEVRIVGEGFLDDAVATWERDGVADTLIVVNQVTFVSGTELRATISIGRETDLGRYDIAVTSRRKKGIGSEDPKGVGQELFTVKEYTPAPLGFVSQGLWTGTYSWASAINDDGVVVGHSTLSGSGGWNAVLYWTEAGGVVAVDYDGGGAGINSRGWIVGNRGLMSGTQSAFVFADGVVTDLEPLRSPYRSVASAINDAGTVVGYGTRDQYGDPSWPVVWRRDANGEYGKPEELPLPDGEVWTIGDHWEGSSAFDINTRGDIVGELLTGRWQIATRAVLWRALPDGSYEAPVILPGAGEGAAISINDAGWIVGSLGGWNQPSRAVLWIPEYDRRILLGGATGAETAAYAINEHGQIVGYHRAGQGNDRGILWTVDASGRVLKSTLLEPAPGYRTSHANDINNHGWIIGTSMGGTFEATLWRPDM
jgi:uncharacterized membrane protein